MKRLTRLRFLITVSFVFGAYFAQAQFPPPAGQPGTTAMFRDSSAFVNWATSCTVRRGFVNLSDTTITFEGHNRAFYGTDADATGFPDDFVVSLGDGGEAILTFEHPIFNGPGPDFAVFENSLNDSFLELGFVEVSSDGHTFYRFPAVSYTQTATQVPTFGSIDAFRVNNLAGKYRGGFGTPFDLDTLMVYSGLQVNRVTHIRIVDVVGCIQPAFTTFDALGNPVNDPWPTPFNSCGFDLDAVGVIHENVGTEEKQLSRVSCYPNPVVTELTVTCTVNSPELLILSAPDGRVVLRKDLARSRETVDVTKLLAGLYLCRFVFKDGSSETVKIIKI